MVYFIRSMPENYKFIQLITEPFSILISILSLIVKLILVPLTSFTLPNFQYILTLSEILLLYILNGDLKISILSTRIFNIS